MHQSKQPSTHRKLVGWQAACSIMIVPKTLTRLSGTETKNRPMTKAGESRLVFGSAPTNSTLQRTDHFILTMMSGECLTHKPLACKTCHLASARRVCVASRCCPKAWCLPFLAPGRSTTPWGTSAAKDGRGGLRVRRRCRPAGDPPRILSALAGGRSVQ